MAGHGDLDSNCQVFDFMVGALFYNGASNFFSENPVDFMNASDIAQLRLMEKYSIDEITRMAYNISYAAIGYGEFLDPEWRAGAYDFCTLEGVGACSILMFNPFGREINSVSEFYYQVPYPACYDSFTVPDDQWQSLAARPPVDLVQEYYACKATVYDALFNSVGIASGNTATFVPILMLFLLPLIYMYLSSSGNLPPKKEYDDEDLEKATKAFATALLRIRDGKVRGMKKGGALTTVAVELMASASVVAAYPDSDDDESDDENGGVRATSFSVYSRKLAGDTYVKKVRVDEEVDSDDDEDAPRRVRKQISSSNNNNNNNNSGDGGVGGFFDNMFASNPIQQGGQDKDMEMGPTRRKRTRRKTRNLVRIQILNRVDNYMAGKGVDSREAPDLAARVLKSLRKAQSVVGLDGADTVFNQAVKLSAELQTIDVSLLSGINFSSLFSELHQAAELQACLLTDRADDHITGADVDKFAYQVGNRVYTLRDLRTLSLESAKPSSIQTLGFVPE